MIVRFISKLKKTMRRTKQDAYKAHEAADIERRKLAEAVQEMRPDRASILCSALLESLKRE